MRTYLLTWNPSRYPEAGVAEASERLRRSGRVQTRWSCGRSMRIRPRDRVYLLRQGPEPRGIIGAGAVVRGSYSDVRWDDPTRRAAYVVVEWTHLSVDPLIPRQGLGQVADVHWDTRSSGIEIPAPARNAVERLWRATSVSVP